MQHACIHLQRPHFHAHRLPRLDQWPLQLDHADDQFDLARIHERDHRLARMDDLADLDRHVGDDCIHRCSQRRVGEIDLCQPDRRLRGPVHRRGCILPGLGSIELCLGALSFGLGLLQLASGHRARIIQILKTLQCKRGVL